MRRRDFSNFHILYLFLPQKTLQTSGSCLTWLMVRESELTWSTLHRHCSWTSRLLPLSLHFIPFTNLLQACFLCFLYWVTWSVSCLLVCFFTNSILTLTLTVTLSLCLSTKHFLQTNNNVSILNLMKKNINNWIQWHQEFSFQSQWFL